MSLANLAKCRRTVFKRWMKGWIYIKERRIQPSKTDKKPTKHKLFPQFPAKNK